MRHLRLRRGRLQILNIHPVNSGMGGSVLRRCQISRRRSQAEIRASLNKDSVLALRRQSFSIFNFRQHPSSISSSNVGLPSISYYSVNFFNSFTVQPLDSTKRFPDVSFKFTRRPRLQYVYTSVLTRRSRSGAANEEDREEEERENADNSIGYKDVDDTASRNPIQVVVP